MTALDSDASGGRALSWGIKASLLDYVRGMPDGSIEATDGATTTEDGFRFPATNTGGAGGLAFRGTVTLTGHTGMMRVVVADPSLVQTGAGWSLEIADPDDAALRLPFATIAAFDGTRATSTALTEAGADLFFGPYVAGTPLDDPSVTA